MSIQSRWYDQARTIFYTDYGEIWTWGDAHTHNEAITTPLLQSVKQSVIYISDFSRTLWVTHGIFLDNMKESIQRHHALPIEMTIFILQSESMEAAMKAIFSQHGTPHRRYAFVPTLEDALHLIEEHRQRNSDTANV